MTDSDKAWDMLLNEFHLLRTDNAAAHAKILENQELQNGRIRRLEMWRSGICYVGSAIVLIFGAIKGLWKPGT